LAGRLPPEPFSSEDSRLARRSERNTKSEAASDPRLAFQPDGSTVLFDQPPGDRQAQAGALADAFGGRSDLIKLIENRFLLLFPNADPGVADREFPESVNDRALDADAPAFRREFHSVTQQVVQDLFQADA